MDQKLIDFINKHEELIDNEEWVEIFRICPQVLRKELKTTLTGAGIKIDLTDDYSKYISLADASKYVSKLIPSLRIVAWDRYNDKGKTGRKLKWVGVHIPSNINDVESVIRDDLKKNHILYEYVEYYPNYYVSGHIMPVLIIRLLDPEVLK
mgnify:CR=1 FL=1